MKLALTEEQLDKIFEYFDKESEQGPEVLNERHYDEFVRIFHRLLELKDDGIIKDEEFAAVRQPMFDILVRMKEELPFLYGTKMGSEEN